jgi:hypothetical protein
MKIALIYPPSLKLHDECLLMPSLAVPVLAGALRGAGHSVAMSDFNVYFHDPALAESRAGIDFGALSDENRTLRYLRRNREPGLFRRIEEALLSWQNPGRADLYGITLTSLDLFNDPPDSGLRARNLFLVNAAALIASRLKKAYGAPVVIGNDQFPEPGYRDLLARYKCFDFAVCGSGEASLLALCGHLSGKRGLPPGVLANGRGKPRGGLPTFPPAPKSLADYGGFPLEAYAATTERLFSRYGPEINRLKPLLRGELGGPQLIAPLQFDDTCRGRCAFCSSGDLPYRCRHTPQQVFEALCRMRERGATGVYFINSNFNNTYKFADELCGLLIKSGLGLQWCDCVNFRELDSRLLKRMRTAGAVKLTFGFETGSARLLRDIRKGVTTDMVRGHLRNAAELGFWNSIELIAGLPGEKTADISATEELIIDLAPAIDSYSLGKFTLFLASPFGRQPDEFGLRLRRHRLKGIDYLTADASRFASSGFDEKAGLNWAAKRAQISESRHRLLAALRRCGCLYDRPQHIHLLLLLYRLLGHGRKPLLRRLFQAFSSEYKPYYSEELRARL